MKNKTIFVSIFSLVLIIFSLVTIGVTYGWFSMLITFPAGQVGLGDLRFEPTGAFQENSLILVPSEDLVDTPFTLTNNSTITSQLRIKITYTKITSVNDVLTIQSINYSGAEFEHINVVMNPLFEYVDGYWYYNGVSYVLPINSGVIDILSSLSYNGAYAGIDYSGQAVNVTLKIEIKQADNVTWEELVDYNFSSGYPE
jgi:hypothetical protein